MLNEDVRQDMPQSEVTTQLDDVGKHHLDLPSMAVVLGGVSIVIALVIGYVTYQHTLEDTEARYHEFYLNKARMLVAAAESQPTADPETALAKIESLWRRSGDLPGDEYVCVVDSTSALVCHTAHPSSVGKNAGKNAILDTPGGKTGQLSDLVESGDDYVGRYVSSAGQQQIAAFAYVPSRRWVLGVHRSREALIKEVRGGIEIFQYGFIAVCGLLMPLSLVVLYLTFRHSQRRRMQAEADRTELEDKYRQSQKMEALGCLTGGIAHDFNNQMTVVMGFSESVLRKLDKDNPAKPMVEEIHKAGRRAAHLTRQMLAFSRKQILQPKKVNLNDILAGVGALLARTIGEHIKLSIITADDLGWTDLDSAQFEHAIMNLAVNARDAMPDGGKLTIRTANIDLDGEFVKAHPGANVGPHVMLEVADTGTGMNAETLERIFDPFFTTKDIGAGTGLGLSMVFGFVKRSGGYICAKSRISQGTVFQILLPRTELTIGKQIEQTEQIDQIEENCVKQNSETILVVEDDQLVRQYVVAMLREQGYSVMESSNAKEAIPLGEHYEGVIDLLLTDVVMPEINGPDLAGRLRDSRPDLNVIYMSGYPDKKIDPREMLRDGFTFLRKPFSSDDLVRTVRETLDAAMFNSTASS
ncbi:MAG: response regulator [Phycisphaerae bacterium]|jgi:signal transduction histidine kinase/CheY-like chemotaxis protein|nr:response regulator [Phycisphaerae bacterium]